MNSLVLFKNNLRLDDNPVLFHASENSSILPIYIYDNVNIERDLGAASKYWLHNSLRSLNKSLDNRLVFLKGDTSKIVCDLIKSNNINKVFCEKPFQENDIKIFNNLKNTLSKINNLEFLFFNTTLLWEPSDILKNDNTPYKVFTPFYRKGCLTKTEPRPPLNSPKNIKYLDYDNKTNLDDLDLIDKYNWSEKFNSLWSVSESSAKNKLKDFLDNSIYNYKKGRDFPASDFNSKLSPFIRFGLVSVNRIWYELLNLKPSNDVDHFKSELGWREFSYYLLYHFSFMKNKNFQKKFDNFEWEFNDDMFDLWKKGKTGFPLVDAGMRELWETGYMHNRVRMVVASFLVKNLSIDWKRGEDWFWDCLLDADHASNIASWQWAAGTGADAAPYFRIFNPILQSKKFDFEGEYILKYVPELKKVPPNLLHEPWDYEGSLDYPNPMIDYRQSRENALLKYSFIK